MKRSEEPKKRCFCPYCEGEVLVTELPYCQPCGVALRYCVKCQIAAPREAEVCPQCGGKLEWK